MNDEWGFAGLMVGIIAAVTAAVQVASTLIKRKGEHERNMAYLENKISELRADLSEGITVEEIRTTSEAPTHNFVGAVIHGSDSRVLHNASAPFAANSFYGPAMSVEVPSTGGVGMPRSGNQAVGPLAQQKKEEPRQKRDMRVIRISRQRGEDEVRD